MNLLIEAPDDFGHVTITFIWTPLLGSTIALWTPNPLHRGEGGWGWAGNWHSSFQNLPFSRSVLHENHIIPLNSSLPLPPPQAKNEWSSFLKSETVFFEKVLMGNTDYKTAVGRILNPAIIARFVKINVKSYSGYPSLRVELFGCSDGMWLIMSNFW